jgi:hypothetical protein
MISGVAQKGVAVTFIVHASRGEDVTTTIRLSVVVAIAKGRTLADEGWQVFITGPDGIRYYPSEFDRLLRSARDREFAVFPGSGAAATGPRRPTRVRRPDALALH